MKSLFIVIAAMFLIGACFAKKTDKCTTEFKGCKLQAGDCVCGISIACTNPYPYLNEHQCEKDITGELDKCRKEPCDNGQCVQVKTDDGFRKWECSCSGSGFHGKRCQIECRPLKKNDPVPENYPTDCIY